MVDDVVDLRGRQLRFAVKPGEVVDIGVKVEEFVERAGAKMHAGAQDRVSRQFVDVWRKAGVSTQADPLANESPALYQAARQSSPGDARIGGDHHLHRLGL